MKNVDLSELTLKKVKITGDIIGKFGMFEIEQVYRNNTGDILEVEYTFPIVETATVVGFEITVGEKILRGKCKEKKEAIKEYQHNIVKGNSAYMMEQKTANIFRISVGKIDKKEEVTIKIQYIDKFEIVDNKIEVFIPTLVAPKYKSNITNKLTYGKVDYTVDFNINIDKALNVKSINCSSHPIGVIEGRKVTVEEYDLSKDFKLNIELKNELISKAITSKTRKGEDILYLSFMPEINDEYEESKKEYIFIVDISGSMQGDKLEKTKKAVIECLKQLNYGDKFNVIAFDDIVEFMNINAIEYNDKNVEEAERYINNLHVRGGTEILAPLKFALYENTEKIILLFTDGQVGNEKEVIDFIKERGKNSRIFPFGIDTNVNSYFIRSIAKEGNGKAELIQPNEKIDDKIIRTFARIQTPMVEDIQIDYGKNELIDEIKEENNLFNYEFFNVFAKVKELKDDIKLKGRILDKEYIWQISKEEITSTDVDLELLFAKQEIERLKEYLENTTDYEKKENYKKMIVDISVKYNINSEYTAFITVYERKSKLLGVPKHQEITLSNNIGYVTNDMGENSIFGAVGGLNGIPAFSRCKRVAFGTNRRMNSDMDVCFADSTKIDNKTFKQILEDEVDKYYEEFIKQDEKNIQTYLLYAIYSLLNLKKSFDYEKLISFLEKHKQEILSSELYMQLICIYYKDIIIRFSMNDKSKLLNFVNEDYKKILLTGVELKIKKKVISEVKAENIVKDNKILENLDDVIWYLYNEKNYTF